MTTENRQVWQELYIDMEKHDTPFSALGPIYKEIYLSQQKRPKGMDFFDFVVGNIHGVRVSELREQAKAGNKVVATYCFFVPEELVWADSTVPVGFFAGTQFSVPVAEQTLPRITYALIMSFYGFELGRKFEMYNRYVAGTGKFLEVTATTSEMDISAFGQLALKAEREVNFNSLRSVFTESEVVSLIDRSEDAAVIAMVLHRTVAARIAALARRVGIRKGVIFAGDTAKKRESIKAAFG